MNSHELKSVSENSEYCHCEAFFAEACFQARNRPLLKRWRLLRRKKRSSQ